MQFRYRLSADIYRTGCPRQQNFPRRVNANRHVPGEMKILLNFMKLFTASASDSYAGCGRVEREVCRSDPAGNDDSVVQLITRNNSGRPNANLYFNRTFTVPVHRDRNSTASAREKWRWSIFSANTTHRHFAYVYLP